MMGWYNQGGGNLWMLLMPVIWIMLVGAAVWVIVALTRSTPQQGREHVYTPDEILRRRLAAGEFISEGYVRTRDLLHNLP